MVHWWALKSQKAPAEIIIFKCLWRAHYQLEFVLCKLLGMHFEKWKAHCSKCFILFFLMLHLLFFLLFFFLHFLLFSPPMILNGGDTLMGITGNMGKTIWLELWGPSRDGKICLWLMYGLSCIVTNLNQIFGFWGKKNLSFWVPGLHWFCGLSHEGQFHVRC